LIPKTPNPKFNEAFNISLNYKSAKVMLEVWDSQRNIVHSKVGSVSVDLQKLHRLKIDEYTLPLDSKKGEVR